nr:hypothetical protein [uncultured Pedobacter sp.]
MTNKKGYHLFIMLIVLLVHTLALSFWLSKDETIQKQASFKTEEPKGKSITAIQKTKPYVVKDSISVTRSIFSSSFGMSVK